MDIILEGISLGLFLALSMGPIFVALTQASIEKGATAGFAVAFGVWTSDILILAGSMYTIREISDLVNGESFQFWLGLSGAIVLFIYGIILIIKKVKPAERQNLISLRNFTGFWIKGFLINSINPFTFVFWLGVMSTYIIGRSVGKADMLTLLFTIMAIIILSDSAKIIMAKLIRNKLKPKHVGYIARGSGIGLIIFACVLLIRVI